MPADFFFIRRSGLSRCWQPIVEKASPRR
jgi:hypothetical protein